LRFLFTCYKFSPRLLGFSLEFSVSRSESKAKGLEIMPVFFSRVNNEFFFCTQPRAGLAQRNACKPTKPHHPYDLLVLRYANVQISILWHSQLKFTYSRLKRETKGKMCKASSRGCGLTAWILVIRVKSCDQTSVLQWEKVSRV